VLTRSRNESVGDHHVVDVVALAPHQRVDDLARRHDNSPQQDQRLAQLEGPPLHLGTAKAVVEEQVLELLDLGVEGLDRLEVPVDDDIEQAPQQEADTVLGEVGVVVPAPDERVDRQVRRLANGDEVPLRREDSELGGDQLPRVMVEADGVQRDEDVVVVMVELGALPLVQCVLDRERVEAELLGDDRELFLGRLADVHPDDRVGLFEVVGDDGRVEVLVGARAVAVEPRADHAMTVRRRAPISAHPRAWLRARPSRGSAAGRPTAARSRRPRPQCRRTSRHGAAG
jgi:hypothetical protein